jgi:hypothetical protein
LARRQRFRIELRKKVRVGRLVKVLSIFRQATEGTANSHGFFEGGTELATPFEGFTSRKIAMKIPGEFGAAIFQSRGPNMAFAYADRGSALPSNLRSASRR